MILFHDVTWELKGFVGVAKIKIYLFNKLAKRRVILESNESCKGKVKLYHTPMQAAKVECRSS